VVTGAAVVVVGASVGCLEGGELGSGLVPGVIETGSVAALVVAIGMVCVACVVCACVVCVVVGGFVAINMVRVSNALAKKKIEEAAKAVEPKKASA
jgi:uncharacterized membrane protein YqgA involved in biofilm formation